MRENYHDQRRPFYEDVTYGHVKGTVEQIQALASGADSSLPRQDDYALYYGVTGLSLRPEAPDTIRAVRFRDDDVYLDMFEEANGIKTYHSLSIGGLRHAVYSRRQHPEIGGRKTRQLRSLHMIANNQLAVATVLKMRDLTVKEAEAGWPHRFDDELMLRARKAYLSIGDRMSHIVQVLPNERYL